MLVALVFAEYLAAVVVALMYAGGQYLESFAERRASREMTALLARVRTAVGHRNGRRACERGVPPLAQTHRERGRGRANFTNWKIFAPRMLRLRTAVVRYCGTRNFQNYPTRVTDTLSKKCKSLSKKCKVKPSFSTATFLKQESNGQPDAARARHPDA
jgi:hypothetical protein